MADAKISALTDGATAAGTDKIPVERAGANKYITPAYIETYINPLSFKTIAVSGQSDVVADSKTDTLTLAAGSNIAITTNAGTDTITFAVTGLAQADISGLTTASSPQFAGIELGHATDTTITRASAGVIAVEGKNVYMVGGADVALADGGTGSSLTDPNADRLMFWDDSAGAVDWLTLGTNLSITGTTINASGGGGASLDAITAAAADQAGIANGDWNIVWNWAKTTNSEVAFTFGESAASTNGTSTNRIPNQILAKFATVASSTASPLAVYSRGSFVFAISPTTAQIIGAGGSSSAPTYALQGGANINDGMYGGNGSVDFAVGGTRIFSVNGTATAAASGSTSFPAFGSLAFSGNGMWFPVTGVVGITIASAENSRFAAGVWQPSYGAADAVSYAINARKARGTVASPTVITTGDDLLTISGYGYVGATNTYQEAARITFDSTGTISDSATGIGGIVIIHAASVGAEPAEIVRWQAGTTTGGGWQIMDEADANPTTTELDADDSFAIYRKADKLVIAHNVGGVMNYLSIALDGSTTAWTQGTTAP